MGRESGPLAFPSATSPACRFLGAPLRTPPMPFDLNSDPLAEPPRLGGAQMTHEIHIATDDAWTGLQALAAAFASTGARLVGIQGAVPEGGRWAAAVRVAGVTPEAARAVTDRLAASGAVSTARVEHVLWTTKGTP